MSSTGLRLPAFRLVKDGETLAPGGYTKTTRTGSHQATGVIDSRAVFDEFANGATIVFQSMHRYWEPLSRYCRALEIALGHPVQANGYITPPAARGFAAHEDEHDVFVLQSHGTKQWRIHDCHDLPPSRLPLIDVLVAPGDSLYIPAGYPHSASTLGEASVHITVGILTMTWAAVLEQALKVVEAEPELRRPLPLRFVAEDGAFADEVGRRLKHIGSSVAELDPSAIAHRLRRKMLTTRQPLLRGQIHRLLDLDQVGDESMIIRRQGSICVLDAVGGELSVLLGDRELRMPGWLEPAMRVIAAGGRIPISDIPDLDEAGRLVLARRLIREGLIEVIA